MSISIGRRNVQPNGSHNDDLYIYHSLLQEKLRRLAKKDPVKFAEWITEEKLIDMHRQWLDFVEKNDRSVIIAPRGHGKTSYISVLYTLFLLGRDPNKRIKIVSSTEEIAKDILYQITEYIEKSENLREVFPELKPPTGREPWTKTKIYLPGRTKYAKDASIEATGILQAPTAGRFDVGIFDDVVSFRNSIQEPALKDKVKSSFWGNWMPMADGPNAKIIYIGTPWSTNDLTMDLLKNPGFANCIFRIDEDFTPLWPEKWPRDALKAQRKILGRYEFDRAFRCMPISEEERVFKLNDIVNCMTDIPIDTSKMDKYTGVDLAIGKTASAKHTVIFTIAVDQNGFKTPVEIKRARMSSPETARAIVATFEDHHPISIMVENNYYQNALLEWLKDLNIDLPIEPFFTGSQKSDPTIGIPSLASEFELRQWSIYTNHEFSEDCHCNTCIWLNEMVNYPMAKNSDTVIACWLAREAYRRTKVGSGRFQIWDF